MLFLLSRFSTLVCILFLIFLALAGCSTPLPQTAQTIPPPSCNVAAMKSAQAGTLGEPALVEFYTTDCMSCRAIRAEMGILDQRYDGKIKFVYLDADLPESQSFLARYNVRGVPTLALLDRRGRVVSNMPGWPGELSLTNALNELATQP